MKKLSARAIVAATVGTTCLAVPAIAAPVSLSLTGAVVVATGNWAGDLDSTVNVDVTFDLDATQADEVQDVSGLSGG